MTLDWKFGGLALGLVFFLAVLLVRPVGVSTQFVILDGILWNAVDGSAIAQTEDGGFALTDAYLATSNGTPAKHAANPLTYSVVFVVAMVIGGFVSSVLRKGVTGEERFVPELWRANFGPSRTKRYLVAFLGGFIVIYGARLAGGCTSGHLMSGTMQTAVSDYVFATGAFLAAVPTAYFLFPREG